MRLMVRNEREETVTVIVNDQSRLYQASELAGSTARSSVDGSSGRPARIRCRFVSTNDSVRSEGFNRSTRDGYGRASRTSAWSNR